MIHVVFVMLYMLIWALILASRRRNELVTNYSTYENCRRKQATNNCARLRIKISTAILKCKGLYIKLCSHVTVMT